MIQNKKYQNLGNYSGLIKGAVIIAIIALLAYNAVYTISEQEAAVVTTFGIASPVNESGLHFKIPFVQQVTKVDTTIKGFPIGYDANTNNAIEDESLMITSDFNFVNVDFYIEYRVTDPVKALYACGVSGPVIMRLRSDCGEITSIADVIKASPGKETINHTPPIILF